MRQQTARTREKNYNFAEGGMVMNRVLINCLVAARMSRFAVRIVLAASLLPGVAFAEEFIVTTDHGGAGSLRQAVDDANNNGNPSEIDTIRFAADIHTIYPGSLARPDHNDGEGLGPIIVTQSLSIIGPGRYELTIDGDFYWIDGTGQLNGTYPSASSVVITGASGLLFEVRIPEYPEYPANPVEDQEKIKFTLSGVTVKRTMAVVFAREGVDSVDLLNMSIVENAKKDEGSFVIVMDAILNMDSVRIEGNFSEASLVAADSSVLRNVTVQFNKIKDWPYSFSFSGDRLEVVDSHIDTGKAQFYTVAENNFFTNTVFTNDTSQFSGVLNTTNNLVMRNVTVMTAPLSNDNPNGDIASHLDHHLDDVEADVVVDLGNTVFGTINLQQEDPDYDLMQPFVRISKATSLIAYTHADDGSLTGVGLSTEVSEGPSFLDSTGNPKSGSPLIDAGENDLAILANNDSSDPIPLEYDVKGQNRISGDAVDIGAIEVQSLHAVNDEYTISENEALFERAPGVLANDTFDLPGTLKRNSIIITTQPTHGHIDVSNKSGGFLYTPDQDFYGTDSFAYIAAFSDPVGLLGPAWVTITVEPIAQPPVVVTDSHEVVHEETLIISAPGVLGNDLHPDNLLPTPPHEGLTAELVSPPSSGVLKLSPDGSYTYKSVAPGTYSFFYKAVDPLGEMSEAGEVVIVVHPIGSELGHQGLSHGYWKKHPEAWHGTVGYEGDHGDDTIIKSVEGFQSVAHHFIAAADYGLSRFTMEDALSFKGGRDLQGAARNLLEQAVAALLNAAHHNIRYPYTVDDVIDLVNEALESGDRDNLLDLAEVLDEYNNLGGDI